MNFVAMIQLHKSIMKRYATIINFGLLSLPLAFALLCACLQAAPGKDDLKIAEVKATSARSRFVLPKFVTFQQYKVAFKKEYQSEAEESSRQKLYLAREFRAYVSSVSYKHGWSSSYLRVNQLSDRTEEEIQRIMVKLEKPSKFSEHKESRRDVKAELEDVEEKLDEFSHSGDAEKRQIAGELSAILPPSPTSSKVTESSRLTVDVGSGRGQQTPTLDTSTEMLSRTTLDSLAEAALAFLNSYDQPESSSRANSRPDTVFIDHRGCFPEIKDQGLCNSCYIFTVLSLYEWNYCEWNKKQISFSEQYALDCGSTRAGLPGCNAGKVDDAAAFVASFGLELSNEYPYKGQVDQCPFNQLTPPNKMGRIRIDEGTLIDFDTNTELDLSLQFFPMIVQLMLDVANFAEFGGGVDSGKDCSAENGLHAVVIVGSGREDNQDYYLMRNSFGSVWGEQGHYKLNKKAKCFYNNVAFTLDGVTTPVGEVNKDYQRA